MTAASAGRAEPNGDAANLRDNPAIAQLAELGARFVGWNEVPNRDSTKPPRKIPVRPCDGKAASSTNPDDWATIDEAKAAVARHGLRGIGVVLGDGLAGVDLDSCRDPSTGEIAPWSQDIIRGLASYAEVSPSGTGVKVICRVDPVPELQKHKCTMGEGGNGAGHPPAVEIYTKDRYFTLTGERLEGTPDEIVECTPAFERLAVLVASGQDHGAKGNGADFGELPDALDKLLKAEPELKDKWESGEKLIEGKDNSRSAFDFTLTVWLARRGYGDETIELALRHYPHGQFHELAGKAVGRRSLWDRRRGDSAAASAHPVG